MNHVDLCSGIAGFSLAASIVWGEDHNVVAFCEKEPFCHSVIRKYWTAPIIEDIRQFNGKEYGAIGLLTAGFPCQPVSISGKRGGTKDDRWLWPETLRVIKEGRPRMVLLENVAGLVSMAFKHSVTRMALQTLSRATNFDVFEALYVRQETMLLENICQEIEEAGYQVVPVVVPACAVNAPHRRSRVWIIAYDTQQYDRECYGESGQRQVQEFGERSCESTVAHSYSEGLEERQYIRNHKEQKCATSVRSSHVCDSDIIGCDREPRRAKRTKSQNRHLEMETKFKITTNADVQHANRTGLRTGKTPQQSAAEISKRARESQSGVGRTSYGLPKRLDGHWNAGWETVERTTAENNNKVKRIQSLGNSIVPEVAIEIMTAMKKTDELYMEKTHG